MFSFEIFGRDGKLVIDGLGGSYGAGAPDVLSDAAADGPAGDDDLGISRPDQSWDAEFADFAAADRATAAGHAATSPTPSPTWRSSTRSIDRYRP